MLAAFAAGAAGSTSSRADGAPCGPIWQAESSTASVLTPKRTVEALVTRIVQFLLALLALLGCRVGRFFAGAAQRLRAAPVRDELRTSGSAVAPLISGAAGARAGAPPFCRASRPLSK